MRELGGIRQQDCRGNRAQQADRTGHQDQWEFEKKLLRLAAAGTYTWP